MLQKSETGGEKRPYRLGLDLGTNSLGWFVVWVEKDQKTGRYEPVKIGRGGARVFSSGRDRKGTPQAAHRRVARSARIRGDRFLMRQQTVIAALVRHGLMPAEPIERKKLESLDPYELRARSLDEALPLHHLGRALFHINQRRSFESNRKAQKEEKEDGAVKPAAKRLSEMIEKSGSRTLGELLWKRHQKRESVRARNTSSGPTAEYEFYPTRTHFKDEFDAIWESQMRFNASLSEDMRQEIRYKIFFQRDLRNPIVGKCSLSPAKEPMEVDPDGYRLAWAHPLAQRFRILQDITNLTIQEIGKAAISLTEAQREKIYRLLRDNNKVTFIKLRKELQLSETARFNLETEKRKDLNGDELAARLTHKDLFGKAWRGYGLDRQILIAERLLIEENELMLASWLVSECHIDPDRAERIADAILPLGHCRVGLRAIQKMIPFLESGFRYSDAAKAVGYDHSNQSTGEVRDSLPYYGEWLPDDVVGSGDPNDPDDQRFGRFPNPTVHIGLGQLRRLVNKLINKYGPPTEIVIEMARDLQISPKKKKEIEAEQAKNQTANEKNKEEIEKVYREQNVRDKAGQPRRANSTDLLKVKLWKQLGAFPQCPFSGKTISLRQLLSADVEVEHLIPYADSLDNKPRNLTICFKDFNRLKGKLTPYEAFHNRPDWPDILARANQLPSNKSWRFAPDAKERLNKEGRDFLDRQLHETRWLGRVARKYLEAVCPEHVWVVTGQHTALIRNKWGLDSLLPDHNFTDAKNRADHRHHAIDAFVVAMTSRSLLQKITREYGTDRNGIDIPKPWESIRDDLEQALKHVIVSHRPDHGVEGKLHDATAYGFTEKSGRKEDGNLVHRKPLAGLSDNEIDSIRDVKLREMVRSFVDAEVARGAKFSDALVKFRDSIRDPHFKHGLRRVRILKTKDPKYLLALRQQQQNSPYKAYAADSNLFMEIFEKPDGEWDGEAVTVHQANQDDIIMHWPSMHPGSRLLMRVYKDDLIQIDHDDGERKIVRVVRLEPSAERIRLAKTNESGSLEKRKKNNDDPFDWIFGQYDRLKRWNARPVRVNEIGQVKYVCPPPKPHRPSARVSSH